MKNTPIDTNAPYINITPLIDILLVLLIIFMVISPLKPARFDTKLPAEPDNKDVPSSPYTLIVSVDEKLQLRLNNTENLGTVGDMSKLNSKLTETFQDRARNGVFRKNSNGETEKTVFIKAPRSVKYGEIAKVVDGIKGTGAHPIGLQIDDLKQ
jgi:biopolymer transport protein ExbD